MAWEDRDYNRDGSSPSDYLSSPLRVTGFSVPIGRWFGVPIRLSFWMLLLYLFVLIDVGHGLPLEIAIYGAVSLTAMVICHDFGHRFLARRVGGSLDTFLLWPAGGMIHPSTPPEPSARLLAHGGGIMVNFAFAVAAGTALLLMGDRPPFNWLTMNPIGAFFSLGSMQFGDGILTLHSVLKDLYLLNVELVMINLLPFFWFDGGYLLEAIIAPFKGDDRATRITCVTGMVVATILFVLCLWFMDIVGMVISALLFADSFNMRRSGRSAVSCCDTPSVYYESAMAGPEPAKARRSRWPDKSLVKKAAAARRDQEKIDEILEKVHAKGMQSLNWMEKRELRKATERQRNR